MKTPDQTDPWEDEFRKRFEHFEAEPPADALSRILMQANASTPPPSGSSGWRKYGVLALIGLLFSLLGYWSINRQAASGDTKAPVAIKVQSGPAKSVSHNQLSEVSDKTAPAAGDHQPALPAATVAPSEKPELLVSAGKEFAPGLAEPVTAATQRKLPESRAVAITGPQKRAGYQTDARPAGLRSDQLPASENGGQMPERLASIPPAEVTGLSPADPAVWKNPALTVASLSGKGLRAYKSAAPLPGIHVMTQAEPQQSKPRQRPVWFMSLMPLYTFRQISPNTSDDVYVRQIKTDNGLSGDRVGWRLQAGGEWRLTKWASLRLGVTYGQFRQTVQYSIGAAKPDSVIANLIDDQTLQLTPVINNVFKTQTTHWQYAGLSADAVWHLGAGKRWTYYATTGASVGGYIGPIRRFTGFYQASFGIERPLANSLWLRVEPTVQYGWNAVSDYKGLFLIRPYMYGLSVGLRY